MLLSIVEDCVDGAATQRLRAAHWKMHSSVNGKEGATLYSCPPPKKILKKTYNKSQCKL